MDVIEAFARIKKANRNVVDVVVINKDNLIVRSSSGDAAKEMSGLIQVLDKCRASFKENDELTFLKIKTKRCEILVVPDKEYMLVALLKTSDEA